MVGTKRPAALVGTMPPVRPVGGIRGMSLSRFRNGKGALVNVKGPQRTPPPQVGYRRRQMGTILKKTQQSMRQDKQVFRGRLGQGR